MSQAIRDFEKTFESAADLTDKQFHFVKLDSDGKVVLVDGETDKNIGVLQNKPDNGEAALVRFAGTTKVKCGDTIGVGAYVTSGAGDDGEAEPTTTAGQVVRGIHIGQESASDGDVTEILLTYFHHKA